MWRHGRGHTLGGKDPSCPQALLYANFAPLNIFFLLSTDKTKVAKVRLFLLIAIPVEKFYIGQRQGVLAPPSSSRGARRSSRGMLRTAAARQLAANQGQGSAREMRPIAPIWSTHTTAASRIQETQQKQRQPNWSKTHLRSRSETASAAVWGFRFQAGSERRCDRQFGELPIQAKIFVHFCCNWLSGCNWV